MLPSKPIVAFVLTLSIVSFAATVQAQVQATGSKPRNLSVQENVSRRSLPSVDNTQKQREQQLNAERQRLLELGRQRFIETQNQIRLNRRIVLPDVIRSANVPQSASTGFSGASVLLSQPAAPERITNPFFTGPE